MLRTPEVKNRKSKIRFVYHEGQRQVFYGSNARKRVIVKGRRWGLTHGYAQYIIEQMLRKISPILWVDTVYSNIDRYVERYFYPILSQFPPNTWAWKQQKKELFILDSVLDLRSADRPELLEGFAYKMIFLNEAGIILKNRYLWENAIFPMILDYNPVIFIGGTPKGRNIFFELAQEARTKENWQFFHFSTYDNPFLPKELIEEIDRDLPERAKRQEIYAEFLENEGVVFRNIKACIRGELEDPQPGRSYVIGWDIAKYEDYSVVVVMDRDRKHVVAFDRFGRLDYSLQMGRVEILAKKYNDAFILVDATGVGDPILESLRNRGLNVEGFVFTPVGKKQLIESLVLAIERREISFPEIPQLISELELFGYDLTTAGNVKYSAPEGHNDDCVMALALAWRACQTRERIMLW